MLSPAEYATDVATTVDAPAGVGTGDGAGLQHHCNRIGTGVDAQWQQME